MRCYCCNRVLSDYESTLKSSKSGDYLDTCSKCLEGLGIETVYVKPESTALVKETEEPDFIELLDDLHILDDLSQSL